MMFSKLKIGPRLGLGFAAVLAAFAVLWALAATNIQHAKGLSSSVAQRHEKTAELAQAQNALWMLRADLAQALATPDLAEREQIGQQAPVARKHFDAAMFNYNQQGDHTSAELALRDELGAAFGRYGEARARWFELAAEGNDEEATRFRTETVEPAAAQAAAALQKLIELQARLVVATDDYYGLELKRSQWFIHLVGVSALGAAALLIWLLTRSITVPLREAVASVETVARGDLTREIVVRSRDEVGQLLHALQSMQASLRNLVGDVANGAHSVADASAQIAQGNLDLSQRTEEQASTLQETASSMEELTATVNQNAEHARQANELAGGASQVAARGGAVVGEVVRTMTGISESSRRISEIIGVIDGIAFQTNILALNAAVEAARAGEQGRGFAVVAAEVRNLAQRSASAAKEIKGLIGNSVEKVETGSKLVHDAGVTMQEIVASVKKVSELIAEIASASQEQSQGIGQVSAAVSQMDQVVQQNATLVEEATGATESMKEQAAALLRAVSRFNIGERATGRQPPAATTRAAEAPTAPRAPIGFVASPSLPPAPGPRLPAAKPEGGNGEWKEF